MKHFALLFTIYLSVLTIAPAFVTMFPCMQEEKEQTCENSCSKEKENGKNDCNKTSNCPFGICCNNCLFFSIEHKELAFFLPSIVKEKLLPADEHCCSLYISDCWHPPELV